MEVIKCALIKFRNNANSNAEHGIISSMVIQSNKKQASIPWRRLISHGQTIIITSQTEAIGC